MRSKRDNWEIKKHKGNQYKWCTIHKEEIEDACGKCLDEIEVKLNEVEAEIEMQNNKLTSEITIRKNLQTKIERYRSDIYFLVRECEIAPSDQDRLRCDKIIRDYRKEFEEMEK